MIFQVVMVFIHLSSPMLNKARVCQRVALGGHNVPDEKVEQRIPRTLENVRTAIALCDQVKILDNSSAHDPFVQLATIYPQKKRPRQRVLEHKESLPDWLLWLLGDIDAIPPSEK